MSAGAALALVMTASQAYWANEAYKAGAPYNVGYTLAGLEGQESSFCRFKVNSWSRGCLGLKRSTARLFDPGVTRQQLQTDDARNLRDGLAFLLYCRNHTRDWRQMVYAYHWGLPKALAATRMEIDSDGYVKAVSERVRQLQQIPVDTK